MKKQCIWCDVEDHITTRDCDQFQEAVTKNLVFWKDKKIHANLAELPLSTNFKNGGMKKILEEMLANATNNEGATFGVQVEDGQRSD